MRVDVVSVAWNSGEVLPDMARSLPPGTALTVVDNGPDDGLRDWLAGQGHRVIVPPRNLGFGAGCNLGAGAGEAPLILFLNPDARLGAQTLDSLCAAARDFPDSPAFGAVLADASGQISYKRGTKLAPDLAPLGRVLPGPDPLIVPALSGAALLVRRADFEAIGGFDPQIFLFYEDDDLSLRLARQRGPLRLVPGAVVTHVSGTGSGAASATDVFKGYHWGRSRVYTARKYGLPAPWLGALRNALWQMIGPKSWRAPRRRREGRGRLAGVWSLRRRPAGQQRQREDHQHRG